MIRETCFISLFLFSRRRPRISTLFPYTTLFRSDRSFLVVDWDDDGQEWCGHVRFSPASRERKRPESLDRKSTRLNSSHANISYAVFCLKKKQYSRKKQTPAPRSRAGWGGHASAA